jgi:hypothetical protein
MATYICINGVSRKAQHGLFYQLSMSIDYTLEDNPCGTEIKIECCIGHKILPIWKVKQEQCLGMYKQEQCLGILIIDEFTNSF